MNAAVPKAARGDVAPVRRSLLVVGSIIIIIAMAAFVGSRDSNGGSGGAPTVHSTPDHDLIARSIALRMLEPDLDADAAVGFAENSARWRAALAAEGTTARAALARVTVSDAEVRAWYEAHRSVFGRRTLEDERANIVNMVRLTKFEASMNNGDVP